MTRKQQILTRFPHRWDILFIEPYGLGKAQHWKSVKRENITVITIPFMKTIPHSRLARVQSNNLVQIMFSWFITIYLQIVLFKLGFNKSSRLIGLSNVYWGKIASKLKATLHFYDANDGHLDFPNTPIWLKEYLHQYLQKSEINFSVSPEISKKISDLGARNIINLGNGVNFHHFNSPQNTPEELQNIEKPILGYAGAMDWLDIDLVQKICIAFPNYEIVLIGPEIEVGWYKKQVNFQGLKNIRYLGKVNYRDLPAYVQSFKVALIPFVVNELTRPLNPNKLYEYSAAGKVVVSMNYSSTIQKLKDIIFVGNTHEEFLEQIEIAIETPKNEVGIHLAKQNSWDDISRKMENSLLETI